MKQVVQPVAGGAVAILDVPRPVPGPADVLVRTVTSVISPGTEAAVTALARASLVAKARQRPDLVRQVVRKARAEGVAATARTVRSRLADDIPLGYSAAGLVIECGPAVAGLRPGQLVATGGAGRANHAEFQSVPGLLCAAVPDGVEAADAAFATVASIALHGLRLAEVGPGAKVVVVGLGLIGQLAARLAIAAGCDVAGIDPAASARDKAAESGVLALDELGEPTTERILAWSRGRGADAVLVCAATHGSGPLSRAPAISRDRAPVVIVGDVGVNLDRTPFYKKELSLHFARSYGPGRYELSYEGWGVDYPAGQVRWTEGRNLEAVLDLLASGRLGVADLVTHRFEVADADAAYRLIAERTEPYLAIQLTYPAGGGSAAVPRWRGRAAETPAAKRSADVPGVGWLGAGAFTSGTLLPAFQEAGFGRLVAVSSASGLRAMRLAERFGFAKAVSGAMAVIEDPEVSAVVVATPHDSHAELTRLALDAGRDVWCEKPLALSDDELDEVEEAWRRSGRHLAIGFNRRWSPAVGAALKALGETTGPRYVSYRVAAGPVPDGHWYADRRQGGRLLGEVCHFIDTAHALIGSPIEEVTSVCRGGPGGLDTDVVVAVGFDCGSLASICYTSALPVAGKELIEVLSGSRRVVIDDFRSATADGRTIWKGRQDKGHRAQAGAFWRAVRGELDLPTEVMIASMRATIKAADPRAGLG